MSFDSTIHHFHVSNLISKYKHYKINTVFGLHCIVSCPFYWHSDLLLLCALGLNELSGILLHTFILKILFTLFLMNNSEWGICYVVERVIIAELGDLPYIDC